MSSRRVSIQRSRIRQLALVVLLVVTIGLVVVDLRRHNDAGANEGLRTSYETPRNAHRLAEPAGEGPPANNKVEAAPRSGPQVPQRGSGEFTGAAGATEVVGRGELWRYQVVVENEIGQDVTAFAAQVDGVLADPRSWTAGGTVAFERVETADQADFVIYLASPQTVDALCYPLDTDGYTSCRVDNKVVINLARWLLAVPDFPASLDEYRSYVVNHEVGHRLGHGHEACPGADQLAPVMQQQTLGLTGCRANPWPYVDGARYSGLPTP